MKNLLIKNLESYAKNFHVPIVRKKTCKHLLKHAKKASSILEIGTAIGYSGIRMLQKNKKAALTTIEMDEKFVEIAKCNFEKSGMLNRVNVVSGDAFYVLDELVNESCKFDMIFLDGPKGQYNNYLPKLYNLLNCGGVIFADNINFLNMIKSGQVVKKHKSIYNSLTNYLKTLDALQFATKIYFIEDGFAVSKKQ